MKLNKLVVLLLFFVFPASTKYRLEGFSLGNAGGGQLDSTNYSINGVLGEAGGNRMVGGSYGLGAGLVFAEMANVPKVTIDNPNNYYNKLHFVIDRQNNPSDAKYALAISMDDFETTQYIKYDGTVGTSLTFADYQKYSQWGGVGGSLVVGLEIGTSYSVKAKATSGEFSESGWGPMSKSSTINPTLVFDLNVGVTYGVNFPPYLVGMGDLHPDTVTDSVERVWVDLETNAGNGGSVFVYGENSGLYSVAVGYTIASINGNLAEVGQGFGAQGVGVTQTAGGPLMINSPYDGSGDVVGITDGVVRPIFTSTGPINSGRGSFILKAKTSNETPSASDYSEILTVIGSANY